MFGRFNTLYFIEICMSNTIFGYGSLILPESVFARFDSDIPDVSSKYENRVMLPEDVLVCDLDELLEKHSDITILPARVRGFIRTYTFESERGGAMLEAYYTGGEEDILNGVVITGLDDEQYDAIQGYESEYDEYTISESEFEFYVDVPDDIVINPCTLYLGGSGAQTNWSTSRVRHPTYHSRILAGIEQLGELYGEDVRDQFWKEFSENTYEFPEKTLDINRSDLNNF